MIEEQVKVEVLAADFEVILASHESEALAELEEQRAQVVEQAALQVPLGMVPAIPRNSKL